MHILKIIHGYPPGYSAGSEVYSQSLCQELHRQGHRLSIFSREEEPYRPDFELRSFKDEQGLEFHLVNMPRDKDGYWQPQVDQKLAAILAQDRPDVAHIGHLNHLSLGLVQALKKAGVPILFTLHDFWLMCPRGQFLQRNFDGQNCYQLCTGQEDQKCAASCYKMLFSGHPEEEAEDLAYWSRWIGRRMQKTREIIGLVDHFIAPSRYLMNRFIKDFNLPAEKVSYLDYGFPTHYLSPPKTARKAGPFRFGYIGTHIPAKGVNLLIEAFKGLDQAAELKIWGWKDSQSQKALSAMSVAQSQRISFCGGYANEDLVQEVFAQVDAIVVPSIWGENSPLVIHEAQAARLPVITADYGGMAEYVAHGVNGLLFKHRDGQSLQEQMAWAIQHPEEMKQLGQRGYLYDAAGEVPDIKTHTATILEQYKAILHVQA